MDNIENVSLKETVTDIISINAFIFSKNEALISIEELLKTEFGVGSGISNILIKESVEPYLEVLKDNLYFLAETRYVDKVYRDSYYQYYSSKYVDISRYCIRISIFEKEITAESFLSNECYQSLLESYRGYFVLRPTYPHIIGRSIISPKALINNSFTCCMAEYGATAHGLKFKIQGFPHSSQDAETITCAETALWAIMEYFGNKYPEYHGALPSQITDILNEISVERQLPSKGLDIQQMSYTLKKLGFGSRIYTQHTFTEDFKRLISCYIESGIPLIASMTNENTDDESSNDDNIEHTILIIGHKKIDPNQINAVTPYELTDEEKSKIFKIYDYDNIEKEFIFVDDNRPVYQHALLDAPAIHYIDSKWQKCHINNFIVPLYPKIYLEAHEAKNYVLSFIKSSSGYIDTQVTNDNDCELVLRVFLASSRSYKAELAVNRNFTSQAKTYIMEAPMPKFIWVAELSTIQLIKDNKANGLILLDATEATLDFQKPLIYAFFQGKMFRFNKKLGKFQCILLPLEPFCIYQYNLREKTVSSF